MVISPPAFMKVTAVNSAIPLGSLIKPVFTVITTPVMLDVPPGLETNPTK
jgi:hypothetical protein